MRVRTDKQKPLIDFLIVDAVDVARHAGAIAAIYAKELDGMIIRGVLPGAAVEAAVRTLEADAMPKKRFEHYAHLAHPAFTVGQPIVGAQASLEAYFEDAAEQRKRIAQLFAGHVDFEQRIYEIFSLLGGGLPAEVAPGPSGKTCPPATVRVLPEGTEIGVHVGNEFIRMPQAKHLRDLVDMTDQISYFIPLSLPEQGGELVVYGLEWTDVRNMLPQAEGDAANVWFEGSEVFSAFLELDSTEFSPGPGDLLIFDGGRYFHRVAKTLGSRPRRTIGGFLGFSVNHDKIYVWS